MSAILVPLDGSELADRAVPFATMLARKTGRPLLLLRAVSTLACPTPSAAGDVMREAQVQLDEVAVRLSDAGIPVRTQVIDAPAARAIVDAAAENDAELVVMATHGRGGLERWIYGSTADAVLRRSPVPTLLVPPHGLADWPRDQPIKILVPLDGSVLAASALKPACDLADLLGGSLLLATFVESSSFASYSEGYVFTKPDEDDAKLVQARGQLEHLAAGLRTATRAVEIRAIFGTPFFDVATLARDVGASTIVMATHGRGGLGRALLGSVATSTLQRSHVPVLIVRPVPAEQMPDAASAQESCATTEASETASTVALQVTPDELEILIQSVGSRFSTEPVDPRRAEPGQRLIEKLRTARTPTTPGVPVLAGGR